MTEDPFSDLDDFLPNDGGTANRSKEAVANFLLESAGKLEGICNYFRELKKPTGISNLDLLSRLLNVIDRYLAPFAKAPIRGRIEATRKKVTDARRRAHNLEFMVTAWEESPRDRPLRERGSDHYVLLEEQDELSSSLAVLIDHLGKSREALEEDSNGERNSGPSIRHDQGPPPGQIGDERSHHVQRRRQIS